jgi:hypothetical protein
VAGKLIHELHALADRLASSDAMTVREAAADILVLRAALRELLARVDNARLPPEIRRRAQMAAKGFSE